MPDIIRIAITGPESSGKSTLTKELARHFNTIYVPEYAREYLGSLNRQYNYDDILHIARGQFKREQQQVEKAQGILFCDTDFLVSKIWCDEKYGRCHPWILEMIHNHPYDLYLLCDADLPWEADPLRENPDDRERLLELYKHELESRTYPFAIISGSNKDRLISAINAINQHLTLNT